MRDAETAVGSGKWRSGGFIMDIRFMILVAIASCSVAKRGSGVFAASNTQLHYLSNRELGSIDIVLALLSGLFHIDHLKKHAREV